MSDGGNSFINSLKSAWLSDEVSEGEDESCEGPPPSRSPFLSDLITSYRRMKEGRGSPEDLREQIRSLSSRLEATVIAFSRMYDTPGGDYHVRKIAEKAQHAFDEHKSALGEMELFFQDGLESHIISGIRLSEECTEQLFQIYEELSAVQEEASKKTCLQCGTKNPPDLKFCQKCKTPFPIISPDIQTAEAPGMKAGKDLLTGGISIPTSFMRVYEGMEKIKKGEISGDEFIQSVEELMATFNEARSQVGHILTKQVEKLDTEKSLKDSVKETGRLLSEGLDEVVAGMEQLISFVTTKHPKALYDGWTRVMNGGQQMLVAQTRYGELLNSTAAMLQNMVESGEEKIEKMTQEEVSFNTEED